MADPYCSSCHELLTGNRHAHFYNRPLCDECLLDAIEASELTTNEKLGQELDRWQLIARDLIELLAQHAPEAITDFECSTYAELKAMPEIHAKQNITLHKQELTQ